MSYDRINNVSQHAYVSAHNCAMAHKLGFGNNPFEFYMIIDLWFASL